MSILVLLLILFVLDFYVFQGLKALMAVIDPSGQNWIAFFYWLLSASFPLMWLIFPEELRKPSGAPQWLSLVTNAWMIAGISKLMLVLSFFGEDIFRFGEGLVNRVMSTSTDEASFLPSRRRFVGQTALVLAALPMVSLTYGMIRGRYQFKVHRKQIFSPDLPDEFEGFTITQISDFHAGSIDSPEAIRKAFQTIQELNSDLLVFTGDLVNAQAAEAERWINDFRQLYARFGKYSILGNHDYGHYFEWASSAEEEANFKRLLDHHRAMGFDLLLNDKRTLQCNGSSIHLLGVENWGVGFGQLGDLDRTMGSLGPSDFKVLLSHDPTHWEQVVKDHPGNVQLTLSGHTHGMQMGIELPGFKWSPIQYRYPRWSDLHTENGRSLYINRGFGVLGYRGRVGIWPEITRITLHKTKEA
ncbi:MAG: metallophosphoesterase [Saprospiraceae bacterium]|nr:metallophosphoesterase [Saprospiraceae bacterium]